MLIEMRDRRIDDMRRMEMIERCAGRPRHARGAVLEEGLIRGYLAGLCRPRFAFELL